jgi:hypothetical protein
VPLLLGTAATAASPTEGRYLTPFREDGARYDAATNTFSGGRYAGSATDANGCVTGPARTGAPAGNPSAYDCLPAGASMVQLPSGKVLFWNALEGEERLTGVTNAGVTDGAEYLVNDESRVLTLTGAPSYAKPVNQDGGAHNTDHPDDLPLGPLSAKHYPYDNGSMFCSDQVLLANGDVFDAGGTDYYTEPYVPVVDKGVIELEGLKNTRWFDASAQAWRQGPAMHYGRWYPSLVTLADGRLLVASGVSKLIKPGYPTRPTESGTNVKQTETLSLGSGSPQWVVNPPTADRSLPLFPGCTCSPTGTSTTTRPARTSTPPASRTTRRSGSRPPRTTRRRAPGPTSACPAPTRRTCRRTRPRCRSPGSAARRSPQPSRCGRRPCAAASRRTRRRRTSRQAACSGRAPGRTSRSRTAASPRSTPRRATR